MRETAPDDRLFAALGHRFTEPAVIEEALTHSSVAHGRALASYERLEFLGDRVLGLILADLLYACFPGEAEGDLARRYAALADRGSVAQVARRVGLGGYIDLAEADAAHGARDNPAILGDCCEAVIGALYLDGGLDTARRFVEANWRPLIAEARRPPRDAKTALQEWAQARGHMTPSYVETGRSGPPHSPRFVVEVRVDGLDPHRGEGSSKREAEQAAARAALTSLHLPGDSR